MKEQPLMWPEGETFVREVMIHTEDESFPVLVTFTVPKFEVAVEFWKNTDPDKAYGLFRQFIVDWDQQDKLTDDVLIAYLFKWPGTDAAIFSVWCEHMKKVLATNEKQFSVLSLAIN
ncbi:hypothetical protein [Yokenella regensburgei]|uniref:hypothetical protein n=1 Tax=Yokenella regensburgei TaxID=158877 RepID=UPI0028A1131C|nr:hypothetical protein [Yokenella regensburgei]